MTGIARWIKMKQCILTRESQFKLRLILAFSGLYQPACLPHFYALKIIAILTPVAKMQKQLFKKSKSLHMFYLTHISEIVSVLTASTRLCALPLFIRK